MTPDVLVSGLRWTFWVLAYLGVGLTAALLSLAYVPAAAPVRWGILAVLLWGIAEDVRRKVRPQPQRARR